MGCFDGAENCKLICSDILNQLSNIYQKEVL